MNDKMEINVQITGPNNSGKSRITYALLKVLEDHGFEVDFSDTDMTNEEFRKMCSIKTKETLEKLSTKTKVTISQTQSIRPRPFPITKMIN